MQLLSELFPPETLEFMVVRTIQLIPFMVLFGFLGHLLDKDNERFRKEEKEKERKERLKDFF
tara:strand:+ start:523 stop:708 length:186 start_codon:yes stop_codon:yes gene_type:complete